MMDKLKMQIDENHNSNQKHIKQQSTKNDRHQKYKKQIQKLITKNQFKLLPSFKVLQCKVQLSQTEKNYGELFRNYHPFTENEVKTLLQNQLCDILSMIKQINRKTSIQLIIKIFHQIVCHKVLKYEKINNNPQHSNKFQRFQKYQQRLNEYKKNIDRNLFLYTKAQSKIQSNLQAVQSNSPITELYNKKFLQFSSPYHVLQYFKYQLTSQNSFKQIQKEPFFERLNDFNLFKIRGHIEAGYNNDRKTAKIFCLVGPGVRAARQFLGNDLGSSSHCKTLSQVVKISYQELQSYINQNLFYFTDQNQEHNSSSNHNQSEQNINIKVLNYFASRRQLFAIKTPLLNCRNWMNNEQLELFFMFVKKAYRIVYNKQWLVQKRNEIFLLFGKITKKLLQREILIKNLKVLKGDDRIKLIDGKKYFGISTQQGIVKLSRRQMNSIQKRNQKKLSKAIDCQGKQQYEVFSRQQRVKKKYQQMALSFRSDM